jgi:plastocyanin
MRHRGHYPLALVFLLAGFLPAGAGPGKPAAAGAADTTLAIRLFQFQPQHLEVRAGTRVTWTNTDEIEHTVTSGDGERADGRFGGVLAGKSESLSVQFDVPGDYAYFCDRHHFMRGTVRVTP